MGSCVSRNNAAGAVDQSPTAKVITLAGYLREYPYPTHLTAAHVLAGDDGASCFLCNSDRLFCDHYIPQLGPDELLRPGQLYFVLPTAKLRHPLSGGDMQELVVRASSALSLQATSAVKAGREKKVKVTGTAMSEVDQDGHMRGGRGGQMDHEVKKVGGEVSLGRRSAARAHKRIKTTGARLSTIPEGAEHSFFWTDRVVSSPRPVRRLADALAKAIRSHGGDPGWEETLDEVVASRAGEDEDPAAVAAAATPLVVSRLQDPDSALAFFGWVWDRAGGSLQLASYAALLKLLAGSGSQHRRIYSCWEPLDLRSVAWGLDVDREGMADAALPALQLYNDLLREPCIWAWSEIFLIKWAKAAAGAVDSSTTAKVITLAGALREYPSHLTAAHVLAGPDRASCFLCSSDELFYDVHIPPLGPEEPLQPGQIYFVLPAEKLRRPLSRSDMKELVARASSALQLASASKKAGRCDGKNRVGKKVGIVIPTVEVDGGDAEEEVVIKRDDDKANPQSVCSATVDRRCVRAYAPVRSVVGFRCRCSPGPMSAIPEVLE
ncbi:hypothetical protein Taro_054457 [Colocasia esculenta]|uniref:Uncharacterized protein n=1 Tax=Colocasia esculenta TaxID=4460 RepID=A0A843XR92_COLES|nr:hypothetical protein [Colocasia esculenta]